VTGLTPSYLQTRMRWFLEKKPGPVRKTFDSIRRHIRGYEFGDLRCRSCLKWIDPDDPQESKEIIRDKGLRMRHKDCPVNSFNANYVSDRRSHRGAKHNKNAPRH
jgi:hypothetical protein